MEEMGDGDGDGFNSGNNNTRYVGNNDIPLPSSDWPLLLLCRVVLC